MPKSNEEYFQEAGRDGSSSSCILLFRFQDRGKLLKHINEIEDDTLKSSAKKRLDEITKYCVDKKCRKRCLAILVRQARLVCAKCAMCASTAQTAQHLKI